MASQPGFREHSFLYFPLFDNRTSHQPEDAETAKLRNELEEYAKSPLPFGLKLKKTPSQLEFMAKELSPLDHETGQHTCHNNQVLVEKTDKLKADHFPICSLNIGAFTIEAMHEANLVGKCYYGKRKLVWEILENGLKKKIEIPWKDILAMRVIIEDSRPGILELELNQPPTFFHEDDPKPRKHTVWKASSDFTGGQASNYRRHYLEFQPAVLQKQYDKFKCESQLWELSQTPFPSLASPYFSSSLYHGITNLPCGYDEGGSQSQPMFSTEQLEQPLSCNRMPMLSTEQFDNMPSFLGINYSASPTSVMGNCFQDFDVLANFWEADHMLGLGAFDDEELHLGVLDSNRGTETQMDWQLYPASNGNWVGWELFDEGSLLYSQLPHCLPPLQVFNEDLETHALYPRNIP